MFEIINKVGEIDTNIDNVTIYTIQNIKKKKTKRYLFVVLPTF